MDDFYSILGVPPNASVAQIRERYRFLAQAYHPDKFASDAHKRHAEEAFKGINEAFQTLSNPGLRADYDRQRANGSASRTQSSPPPPRPAPPPKPTKARSRARWPMTPRGIVVLIIAVGIGVASLLDKPQPAKPQVPSYEDLTAPSPQPKGPWNDFQPQETKSAFDPTTAKPQEPPEAWVPPEFRAERTTQTAWLPPEVKLPDKPSPSPTKAFALTTAKPREEEAAATAPQAATKERPYVNSLEMKFVPVAGTKVLFSVWETRVQDYAVFVKETTHTRSAPPFKQGPMHPAMDVNWHDAVAFCAWLSKKEARVYRLPTDAEWSLAVGLGVESGRTPEEKDGKVAGYPWGKAWPPPQGAGNYGSDTLPVETFAANAFGLYDLSGSVWEWCEDLYSPIKDDHVLRGGSCGHYDERSLRSSFRYNVHPMTRGMTGFRCVLVDPGG